MDVFEALHAGGAALDLQTTEWGDTALHLAAHEGHEHFVKLLVDAGADKTIVNTDGETAWDAARKAQVHHASGDGHKTRNAFHQKKTATLELLHVHDGTRRLTQCFSSLVFFWSSAILSPCLEEDEDDEKRARGGA